MVMAASGSKSAAGATMNSAAQSNATKSSATASSTSSGPRGPTGPSNSQPRSSPAGNSGGSPGSVSRTSNSNPSGARDGGGNGGNNRNFGGSTTSRIGSAASAQRMSSQQASGATSSAPNAAGAKASAAYRASGALNAGLGRDPSPISGALNTSRNIGVGGAALGSFRTATEPMVRDYLGPTTATPFGGQSLQGNVENLISGLGKQYGLPQYTPTKSFRPSPYSGSLTSVDPGYFDQTRDFLNRTFYSDDRAGLRKVENIENTIYTALSGLPVPAGVTSKLGVAFSSLTPSYLKGITMSADDLAYMKKVIDDAAPSLSGKKLTDIDYAKLPSYPSLSVNLEAKRLGSNPIYRTAEAYERFQAGIDDLAKGAFGSVEAGRAALSGGLGVGTNAAYGLHSATNPAPITDTQKSTSSAPQRIGVNPNAYNTPVGPQRPSASVMAGLPAGAALGSFRTATEPVVRNYLGSGTATPFGGYQYGPGQMYADPYRSKAALNSVLNNAKIAGMDPRQTSDAVLRSAGMANPYARAGVLGTFDHESAGFNPTALGDQGTAYGLAQWRGPRQTGLQKYSAGMGLPTGTVGVQTAYALTEMGRAFPKTLNSLQAAQDVPSAVRAMNAYEKPRGYTPNGDPTSVAGWADRVARANQALANVTKDQSRIAPEQGTATAFTKDQSRITPEVPVRTANPARPMPTNVVPSWRQSTYTGPTERILAVEDVPPLGTTAQGGLGVFGVSSPVMSEQPLNLGPGVSTAMRDKFYGGGPTPRPGLTEGMGYGTFNGPSIVTTPDPNASLPNYAGFRQFAQPANPPIPRPRPPVQDYPRKPYGSGTAKAIDSVVNLTPGAGVVNMIGGLFGKSAGDIYTSEENKLANMTPEQRERYRSYWGDVRANAPGRGPENKGSERPAMSVPVSTARSSASTDTPQSSDTASGNWQADALAYGYSEAQLKDPEIRALIKELWDMGFIPKTSTA